ncbi:hypothetical protein SARC_00940 [Sphaeroforma arctica JP610]|uniref:RGS domain-containing protein n=1 Tax=Sphaeroforma arctica JP610 TaxID=667725 RepID=A0A0L0GF60_9EUKA|nr:hypothetical protein SARC_00940 [Sphaeroforma arctica JP610]KNC86938.1 hypothetical protein SARC_00940 [Sphaeroforma arctica JP610]|eukprot:XP_014160840.1 hypothetical protein SARC_00940 [Sphaeroforma arctica JP610]
MTSQRGSLQGTMPSIQEYGEGNRYGQIPASYSEISSKKRFGASPDNALVTLLKKSYKLAQSSDKKKKTVTKMKDASSVAFMSTSTLSEKQNGDLTSMMSRSGSSDSQPGLMEILNSNGALAEKLRAKLLEYAKTKFCEESMLLFLLDYILWHRGKDTDGAVERGQAIVHNYVISSAAYQINMQKSAIASAEKAQIEGLKTSLADIASQTKKIFRVTQGI